MNEHTCFLIFRIGEREEMLLANYNCIGVFEDENLANEKIKELVKTEKINPDMFVIIPKPLATRKGAKI